MNTKEKQTHEARLNDELKRVSQRALDLAQVQEAIRDRKAIKFTCPWGHRLVTVELDVDNEHSSTIMLRPIAEMGRASGPAVQADAPWGKSSKYVCNTAGCPRIIDYVGWCADHGGRQALDMNDLSYRFTCRRCSPDWSDRVSLPRLIQITAMALMLGHNSVSVTGRVASSGKRRAR